MAIAVENPPFFYRKHIFIHGWFSIVIRSFSGGVTRNQKIHVNKNLPCLPFGKLTSMENHIFFPSKFLPKWSIFQPAMCASPECI